MIWRISYRADPKAADIADRHYSRQSIGSPQFVPPGRCFVLVATIGKAYWVTSWPFAEYVKHAWPGAWICSAFRNEEGSAGLSSDLIRQAIAATRWQWPEIPDIGMITFINIKKIRHKRDPGRCFLRAGFRPATPQMTKSGLLALQLLPEAMPNPEPPLNVTRKLFN
jgi:hypothetical protein